MNLIKHICDAISQNVHSSLLAHIYIIEQYYRHQLKMNLLFSYSSAVNDFVVKLYQIHIMVIKLLFKDKVTQKLISVTVIECFIWASCRKMT